MDHVDGLDAGRLLASRFPAGMPTDQVVRVVTAVASALDYAHKRGLLHRDVKPASIMLTPVWVIRPSAPAGPSEEGIGPTKTPNDITDDEQTACGPHSSADGEQTA